MFKISIKISILLFLFISLYRTIFTTRDTIKSVKGKVDKYKIDKVKNATKSKNGKEYLRLCVKYGLLKDSDVNDMKLDMDRYSSDLTIYDYFSGTLPSFTSMLFKSIFIVILSNLFFGIIMGSSTLPTIINITVVSWIIYYAYEYILNPKKLLDKGIKTSIYDIEKNYPLLVRHIYYNMYNVNGKVKISDIMKKFRTFAPIEMNDLIDNFLKDCETSDLLAIRNLKKKYYKSQKMVDLSVKLERCLKSKDMNDELLNSLKDGVDEEMQYQFEKQELERSTRFQKILITGAVVSITLVILVICYIVLSKNGVIK